MTVNAENKARLEEILRGEYAPAEPLARVMIDDAGEYAVIQIAGSYSKRRLSPTAKEFLITGSVFWTTGEGTFAARGNEMTYPELVEFCGDERQVHFLSTKLPYQRMSEAGLVDRRGRAHGSRQGTHGRQTESNPGICRRGTA